MAIQGKRILFIGPRTFGYEKEIQAELERLGAKVVWYDDRPASTPLVKALIRTNPALLGPLSNSYFDAILEKEKRNNHDIVFVIKGEALSERTLLKFRRMLRQARFVYYSWDSLGNFKNSRDILQHFDKCYSFDRFDSSRENKIRHLPLFYTRSYEWRNNGYNPRDPQKSEFDLLFLGSLHSDRYSTVQNIWRISNNVADGMHLHAFFYYQSRWVFFTRKVLDRKFRKIPWRDVSWRALDKQDTLSLIARSRILIDVHHPRQTGLTMRTIESIGVQKKIITTNQDVVNYDFYQPANILVVDRKSPAISREFLMQPYQPLDEEIYRRYSLKEWLRQVLSDG